MRFCALGDGCLAGEDEVYAIRAGGPRVCHRLYDDGIQTPVQNFRLVVCLMKPSVQNNMWMDFSEFCCHLAKRHITNLQKPFSQTVLQGGAVRACWVHRVNTLRLGHAQHPQCQTLALHSCHCNELCRHKMRCSMIDQVGRNKRYNEIAAVIVPEATSGPQLEQARILCRNFQNQIRG